MIKIQRCVTIPGHGSVLQYWVYVLLPSHHMPPKAGLGLSQYRTRYCVPPSQEWEQSEKAVQFPQLPFMLSATMIYHGWKFDLASNQNTISSVNIRLKSMNFRSRNTECRIGKKLRIIVLTIYVLISGTSCMLQNICRLYFWTLGSTSSFVVNSE